MHWSFSMLLIFAVSETAKSAVICYAGIDNIDALIYAFNKNYKTLDEDEVDHLKSLFAERNISCRGMCARYELYDRVNDSNTFQYGACPDECTEGVFTQENLNEKQAVLRMFTSRFDTQAAYCCDDEMCNRPVDKQGKYLTAAVDRISHLAALLLLIFPLILML